MNCYTKYKFALNTYTLLFYIINIMVGLHALFSLISQIDNQVEQAGKTFVVTIQIENPNTLYGKPTFLYY